MMFPKNIFDFAIVITKKNIYGEDKESQINPSGIWVY